MTTFSLGSEAPVRLTLEVRRYGTLKQFECIPSRFAGRYEQIPWQVFFGD